MKIYYDKTIKFISKLSIKQKNKLLNLLREVQKIQKSELNKKQKAIEIKKILWTNQTSLGKLLTGAFIGTLFGLIIFGTGGIGIVGLGSGIGVWGFLSGTLGGTLISSIIQNFEK